MTLPYDGVTPERYSNLLTEHNFSRSHFAKREFFAAPYSFLLQNPGKLGMI